MLKTYDLNLIVINGNEFPFFYQKEKNDINGNSRFRVYIIDPDGPAVHETIFKCYENQLFKRVSAYIENKIGVTIPF